MNARTHHLPIRYPKKIGRFAYAGVLKTTSVQSSYSFGMYQDPDGNTAVCKMWNGVSRDVDFDNLYKEGALYSQFNTLLSMSDSPTKNSDVTVPKLYAWKHSKMSQYILIDYANGKLLTESDDSTIIGALTKTIAFLREVSPRISYNGPAFAMNGLKMIVLFHYYFLRVVMGNALSFQCIKCSLSTFYAAIGELLVQNDRTLVHRDLGDLENIIVRRKKLFIIDFQLATMTHSLVEHANIFVCIWHKKSLRKKFLASPLMKPVLSNPRLKKQFKALVIYATMVSMALGIIQGNDESEKKEILLFVGEL